MNNSDQSSDLLALTTEIVAAHVSNNTVSVGDLPQLINQAAGTGRAPSARGSGQEIRQSGFHRLPGRR